MEKWFDTEIGRNILQAKYYHAGETKPHEFIERVAGIFSPEVREKMRAYLEDGALSPAGRTLYAAGAKGKFKSSLRDHHAPDLSRSSLRRARHRVVEIHPDTNRLHTRG